MYKRILIFISVFLVSLLLFTSCDVSDSTGENKETEKIKILLTVGEGVEVVGETSFTVARGEKAIFKVKFENGYAFDRLSHGTLLDSEGNPTEGLEGEEVFVHVEGLTRNTAVKLFSEALDYDTSEKYRLFYNFDYDELVSHKNGASFNAGTTLSLEAKNRGMKFIGWSINAPTLIANECISNDRNYKFRVSPDTVDKNGVLRLFANYVEKGSLFYDLNGGEADLTSTNSVSDYYTVSESSGRLKVVYNKNFLSVFESPTLFFDDGTFKRSGYVLAEYNTESDGSGIGFSLGSQCFINAEADGISMLYCIWKKESDPSDFTYEEINVPSPTTEARAPHWKAEGIMITGYKGDDTEVVIPEMIDGKYVTAIGRGAFKNRKMTSLVLSRYIHTVEQLAFNTCTSLTTVYYPDSIYRIYNESFDAETTESIKKLYVNATMAPRYVNGFSVKLSRLLCDDGKPKIILIAGSSAYQGFSTEYMEALLGGKYRVINFGTTRTTNCIIYLEAMSALAGEGDTVIYAPENSTYMMGENELYWKTVKDLESFYNVYRHIDISKYDNVFGALSDFNINYRYTRNPARYEDAYRTVTVNGSINKYGEYQHKSRVALSENYVDSYFITLNKRYKSKYEGLWDDTEGQTSNKDYTDPYNKTWQSIDTPYLRYNVNRAIAAAKSGGAAVCFSFCPVDADKLVSEARNTEWLLAYDALIRELYDFDHIIGSCRDYVLAHEYFYDCAFHPNDVGRTYRTYRLYSDLAKVLGYSVSGFYSSGTDFEGCIFEGDVTNGEPKIKVEYLN